MTTNRNTDFFNENFSFANTNQLSIRKNDGFYGVTKPVAVSVPGDQAQTAAYYTACFFIADRSYEVISVVERHEVAGSDGSAVTVQLEKLASGTASGAGVDILTTAFSLKATADTNQTGTISKGRTSGVPDRRLSKGDALSIYTSGTLTAVEGVTVSVLLKAI